jgi:hypothetical protein
VGKAPAYRSRGPGSIPWEIVDLERGPLCLVTTIEEILERNSSGSGLENRYYGRKDPSRCPRDTLYPQKLALTSPTSDGRSIGIVHSRAKAKQLLFKVIPVRGRECCLCSTIVSFFPLLWLHRVTLPLNSQGAWGWKTVKHLENEIQVACWSHAAARVSCLVRVGGATETWDITEVGYGLQWCVFHKTIEHHNREDVLRFERQLTRDTMSESEWKRRKTQARHEVHNTPSIQHCSQRFTMRQHITVFPYVMAIQITVFFDT